MSKKIFITGDSFCECRDKYDHWPFIVSKELNLKLTGEGFGGYSWWPSKILLNEYKNTPAFDETEYFIIVHTEISRPLSYTEFLGAGPWNPKGENYEAYQIWVKYFYNLDFNRWCTKNWYREINDILKDKKVLHILAFHEYDMSIFDALNGIIIKESLLSLVNRDSSKWIFHSNHFTSEENKWLADKILYFINNYDEFYSGQNVWYSIHHTK